MNTIKANKTSDGKPVETLEQWQVEEMTELVTKKFGVELKDDDAHIIATNIVVVKDAILAILKPARKPRTPKAKPTKANPLTALGERGKGNEC